MVFNFKKPHCGTYFVYVALLCFTWLPLSENFVHVNVISVFAKDNVIAFSCTEMADTHECLRVSVIFHSINVIFGKIFN